MKRDNNQLQDELDRLNKQLNDLKDKDEDKDRYIKKIERQRDEWKARADSLNKDIEKKEGLEPELVSGCIY